MTDTTAFDIALRDRVPRAEAQVRREGQWETINLPLSEAVRLLRADLNESQERIEAAARALEILKTQLAQSGIASAQRNLFSTVIKQGEELVSQAGQIIDLRTRLDSTIGTATAAALQALEAQAKTNADSIAANARLIAALSTGVETEIGTATADAIDALTTRVTANETALEAASQRVTTLTAEVDEANSTALAIVDRLTFQVPVASVKNIAATLGPGVGFRAGAVDSETNFVIQTVRRAGRKFTVTLAPGGTYTWPEPGTITVQPAGLTMAVSLASRRDDPATVTMDSQWAVESGVYIPATAQVQEILEARVTRAENVEGQTALSQLSRWLIKTKVGDLVGGIGLYNDGENVDFIAAADRFAIVPPGWDGDLDTRRVPFAVIDGNVYIDSAAIRRASITALAAQDAFLANMVARHGTLAHARIEKGDIFDLTISDRIRSSNFKAGEAGFQILKNGNVQFNQGTFTGNLQSINFAKGSAGWRLGRDGTAEVAAASIRGKLTAAQINTDGLRVGFWHFGKTAPSGTLGAVGDYYQNTDNGDIYEKTAADTWTSRGNILTALRQTATNAANIARNAANIAALAQTAASGAQTTANTALTAARQPVTIGAGAIRTTQIATGAVTAIYFRRRGGANNVTTASISATVAGGSGYRYLVYADCTIDNSPSDGSINRGTARFSVTGGSGSNVIFGGQAIASLSAGGTGALSTSRTFTAAIDNPAGGDLYHMSMFVFVGKR